MTFVHIDAYSKPRYAVRADHGGVYVIVENPKRHRRRKTTLLTLSLLIETSDVKNMQLRVSRKHDIFKGNVSTNLPQRNTALHNEISLLSLNTAERDSHEFTVIAITAVKRVQPGDHFIA